MDSYSEDITDSDTNLQDIRFTTSNKQNKPRRAPTYRSKQSRQNQIDGLIKSGQFIPHSRSDTTHPDYIQLGNRLILKKSVPTLTVDDLNLANLDDAKAIIHDLLHRNALAHLLEMSLV